MSDKQRATWQHEAVQEALAWRAADPEPAMTHVYGPKLYGPPEPGEHHCTAAHPFDGSQDAAVVFHTDTRPLGWTGSRFCAVCGCNAGEEIPC